jgi:transposase-like protein
MNLVCPKCGNKVNPNTKRPQCGKCYFSFNNKELSKFGINSTKLSKTLHTLHKNSTSSISSDIMRGNNLSIEEKVDRILRLKK